MLKVGNQTFGKQSAFGARTAVFTTLAGKTPKEGTTERALMGALAFTAANDDASFELLDVVRAYDNLVAEAAENVKTTAAARLWCASNGNRDVALALAADAQRQSTTLAGLTAQTTVIISRGTNPVQARRILDNVTFGGHPLDATITTPPASGDADAQTGHGVKNTGEHPLEEWSLGRQKGFALDGFMLIAEANVSLVTLPVSDFAVNAGEAGVCGYAAAGLLRVAILEEGRASNEDPQKRELERLNKEVGADAAGVVRRLKEAATQVRGVTF